MANLLHFLGGAAKRVENTINNDVIAPIRRDVVAPAQRVVQAAPQVAQRVQAQVNPFDNGATYSRPVVQGPPAPSIAQQISRLPVIRPLLQADRTMLAGGGTVAKAPVNIGKFTVADLTHNQQARTNALNQVAQAQHVAGGLVQGVPHGLVEGAISARQLLPGSNQNFTVRPTNAVTRTLMGNQPVTSIQHQYTENRKNGMSAADALTQAGISLSTDVPIGLGAAKLVGKGGKAGVGAAVRYDATKNQIGAVGKNVNKPQTVTINTIHQGGVIKKVQGEPVQIHKDLNTVVHKDENGNFVVTEATTGRQLTAGGYPNQHHAIQGARDNINQVGIDKIKQLLAQHKLEATPQVNKPDVPQLSPNNFNNKGEYFAHITDTAGKGKTNAEVSKLLNKAEVTWNKTRGTDWGKDNIQSIPIDKISHNEYGKTLQEVVNNRVAAKNLTPGRKVEGPISVHANPDGTYSIVDGRHRLVQTVLNGDSHIQAEVRGAPPTQGAKGVGVNQSNINKIGSPSQIRTGTPGIEGPKSNPLTYGAKFNDVSQIAQRPQIPAPLPPELATKGLAPPAPPRMGGPPRQAASSLPNDTPINRGGQFSASDYVKQQVEAQKLAAKGELSKGQKIRSELKVKLLDALAPIEDPIIKQIGRSGELNLRNQLDRSLRSPTIAGQFAERLGLHNIIKSVPNVDEFNQLLIAKHAQDLEANGVKTGRNLVADKQLIDSLGPRYQAHDQALKGYNGKLLDQTAKYGLISKDTASYLKQKYPNYVPFDRIFKEGELTGGGNGAGPASLSTQTVVQRIKGSERQIQPPLESILAKTHDVIAQGERNLAAKEIVKFKDLPGNPLGIVPLRTAADVNARFEAYKGLAELKPVRDSLAKESQQATKQIRSLISRNNQLGPQILKTIKGGASDVRKNAVKVANNGARAVNRPTSKRLSKGITESDVHEAFQQYLDGNPKLVRNMYEFMGNKTETARITKKLDSLKSEFDAVKQQRSNLFDEAKLHADAAAKGKSTISFLNNGIKEIHEVTPEVAAAAKSLNKQQLGFLGKVLSYPTRVLRLGATGANAAFAMANVTKDVASAFINTEHPLRASIGNPRVFVNALKAATYHKSGAYHELVSQGAGGTSFDIARNAAKDTIQRVRADRNLGTKALYNVRHPGELLRAVEDTIGRSEEFGRAVQYFGNKEAALAKGDSLAKARVYGADAARNNTINFARAGEYGRVLNSVLPYLNAGIQGSRTLMRNLKDRPVQTGVKIAITGFLPVATATAWNVSDAKRKAAYDDISEYEKQNNIIIVPPNPHQDPKTGRWNVIKIPVSQEIANMNNIVRNGVESLAKDQGFNFAGMAGNLIGTSTSINAGSPRQGFGQVIPQAVKPGVEALTNQNLFTGNKIIPDSMRNLSPQDQSGTYTSGTANVLGKVLGVSPLMLDNTVRTATGGLGQNVINLSDRLLAKTGNIPADQVKGQSLGTSISGRFNSAQGISAGTKVDRAVKQATDKLKQNQDYKNLPPAEKAKALNRLESDMKTAQYQAIDAKNGTGQYAPGFTGKQTKLTTRQQGLLTGQTDLSSYLTTQAQKQASGTSTSTSADYTYKTAAGQQVNNKDVQAHYAINNANLTSSKNSGDINGYMRNAQWQLNNISNQLSNPKITIAKAQSLANQAQSLQTDINKYSAYGGFTKPTGLNSVKGIGTIQGANPDFVNHITRAAAKYGVDVNAALAVAAQEGLGGGAGDGGTSFGPFQMHVGGALPAGKNQAWAESPEGIDYAMQQIASVARGKSGADAIQAIVTGFEKSANQPGEIANALALYSGGSATLASGSPRNTSVTASSTPSGTRKVAKIPSRSFHLASARIPKLTGVKVRRTSFKAPKLKTYKPVAFKGPVGVKPRKRKTLI